MPGGRAARRRPPFTHYAPTGGAFSRHYHSTRNRRAEFQPATPSWLRRSRGLPSLPSVPSPMIERPRRRRRTEAMRRLVREHQLGPGHLIQPVFVVHGAGVEREIGSMPGVRQLSVDAALDREADRIHAAGLGGLILFGIPASKDDVGSENFAPDGIVQQALRRLRRRHADLLLLTDVCFC